MIDDNSYMGDTDDGDPVTGTGVENEENYEDHHVDTPDDTSSNSENTEIATSIVNQSVIIPQAEETPALQTAEIEHAQPAPQQDKRVN